MGLFDSFMPGDTGGMINGGYGQMNVPPPGSYEGPPPQTGGFQGLLSGNNPLFNIGLGILANNQGHYGAFGPAFGLGAQQGIQQTQQARTLAQQKELNDAQLKAAKQKNDEYQRKLDALQAFKQQFPDYGVAADLDPTLAIKAAYPQIAAKTTEPYYQFLPTASGYAAGNARTGKVELVTGPDGQPYIKSADSPQVRGAVKSAEAQAAAAYKPNTDIPGLLSTDEAVARAAYGNNPIPFQASQAQQIQQAPQLPTNNFTTPYPVTLGAMGAPGTTATDRREGTMTDNLGVGIPARPNVGIKIPSKVDLAVQQKVAEMNAESAAKKQNTMSGVGSIIDQARGILTGKVKPTSSGLGNLEDAAGALVGYSPPGAAEADALKAIGGQLVSKMPRMEGPQSNFDVQNYQQMAGDVGNATIPIDRRLKALGEMEKIVRKYDQTSGQSTNAPQAMPLPAKPSTLTLKKGQVYATPKGNLTWNGKAFED